MENYLTPQWPAPTNVRAIITTRQGGISTGPYDSMNLATTVDDDPDIVAKNRQILTQQCQLPSEPVWLRQTHSTIVINADNSKPNVEGDASYSKQANTVCAVLTADCLPVLVCDSKGSCVAAIHAGWRGLAAGIIIETINTMAIAGEQLLVYLGPAMGEQAFEAGIEVKSEFLRQGHALDEHFRATPAGKHHVDMYAIARYQLAQLGVTQIYGGNLCTYQDSERFYSYRRDNVTGRMASLIWLN